MILNKIRNARRPTFVEFVISLYRRNDRNNGEENWLNKRTHCCRVERGVHYLTVVPAKEDLGQFEVS